MSVRKSLAYLPCELQNHDTATNSTADLRPDVREQSRQDRLEFEFQRANFMTGRAGGCAVEDAADDFIDKWVEPTVAVRILQDQYGGVPRQNFGLCLAQRPQLAGRQHARAPSAEIEFIQMLRWDVDGAFEHEQRQGERVWLLAERLTARNSLPVLVALIVQKIGWVNLRNCVS